MQASRSLCALLMLLHCVEPQTILQSPPFLSVPPGTAVQVTCSVQGQSNPYMYWYRKTSQKPFEMMFLSRNTDLLDDSTETHFMAKRPSAQDFILRADSVRQNDTAQYYCAWSLRWNSEQYFGKGTRLTVLEDGLKITAPKVALFDPSPQEVKERGSATLVCLATNFYPDHVVLSWSVNGVERTDGVKNDDQPTRGSDKMYSLSSRLRISKKEWMNPQTTFRCGVYFDPEKPNITTMETKGREGCGVTPASYGRSANTAKFTYLLLITKTAFYGLFVTLCVMKMKPSNEKIFT